MVSGSVRNGSALLVGLLRCGCCGRKLKVLHHWRPDARYVCGSHVDPRPRRMHRLQQHAHRCGIVGGSAAGDLAAGTPGGVAVDCRSQAGSERLRQSELAHGGSSLIAKSQSYTRASELGDEAAYRRTIGGYLSDISNLTGARSRREQQHRLPRGYFVATPSSWLRLKN
ncbi:zinc ribbon domain-containing protein [Mesorhizobium tamadayense]